MTNSNNFHDLSNEEIARLVQDGGSKVCVFPLNGTRRWFMLEHFLENDDPAGIYGAYHDIVQTEMIRVYRLLFDHGIDIILGPMFGPDLLERGEEYTREIITNLARLVTHPALMAFYQEYDIRVRFYGDYRKYLAGTPFADICDVFDQAAERTAGHHQRRLFFGMFAHDATETVAEIAIAHHAKHGTTPGKRQIVEYYYGEYVPPVDLFIGFDKFAAFDMPLLATGDEDLYFTITPSLYLTQTQLRDILYDHLYTRRSIETDYSDLEAEDWERIRAFYQANQDKTLGVGAIEKRSGCWYPLPRVTLTPGFDGEG